MKYDYIIAIDPGKQTGYAVFDVKNNKLKAVVTLPIHKALFNVKSFEWPIQILVRVEDARLRTWFGENTKGKEQGAGSIKRDCTIWEDFLKDYNISYEMVPPKMIKTKVTSLYFKKLTGWTESTNQHGRDAAMMVFGHSGIIIPKK